MESDLPNGLLYVRRDDAATAWLVCKRGSYFSASPKARQTSGDDIVDYLMISKDADTGLLTFSCRRHNITQGTFSNITQPFSIEVMY